MYECTNVLTYGEPSNDVAHISLPNITAGCDISLQYITLPSLVGPGEAGAISDPSLHYVASVVDEGHCVVGDGVIDPGEWWLPVDG